MRKLNVKLLMVLVLGTVTLAVAVGVAHAFQYGRIADALHFQARRAEEQGQAARVARYLSRYLEFQPRDLEARVELARTLAGDAFAGSRRARDRAARLLDEVLTSDPGRDDLRRLLAKVALEPEIGRLQIARKQLEVLLPENESAWPAGQDPPAADASRGELESLWGRLCEAETHSAEAIRFYRQAVRDLPGEQLSYVHLAYMLRRLKETDPAQRTANETEADNVIGKLVENNAESYRAYLARWNYRRDTKYFNDGDSLNSDRLTDAAEDVAKALKRAPESVEVLMAACDLAQFRADVVADDVDDPKDPQASQEKRWQKLRAYREEARSYMQRGLKLLERAGSGPESASTERQLLWVLGNLWLDEIDGPGADAGSDAARQAEEVARGLIDRLRKTKGPFGTAPAEVLQARLWMTAREWAHAVALLEHARPVLQSPPELTARVDLYLGRCYQQMEEPKQALAAYQNVANWDRQSVPARLGLAEMKRALGRIDEALEDYREVMARDKVPARGWLDLARLEIERQLQRDLNQRDWAAAMRDLDRAEAANPGVPDVAILRAEVLVARGLANDAEALLQRECDANPKVPEYRVALATLAMYHGERFAALAVLREAEKVVGDHVELRLARARFWASQPDGQQRCEALAAIKKDADKLPADDRPRLLAGLAEAQYLAGDPVAARALLEELALLPQHKDDLRLRLVLFDLAVKSGDDARIQAALDAIGTAEAGSGPYFLFARALRDLWLVRERKQPEKLASAMALLAQVDQSRPQWSRLLLARADAEELAGDPEAAIVDLRKAVEFGEDGPEAIQRLVSLLTQRKRYDEAEAAMGQLRQSQRRNTQMLKLGAQLAATRGDLKKALALANKAGIQDSKDYHDKLWDARVREAGQEYNQAEEKLREAIALAPAEPDPRVALVRFLAGRKRTAEAEALIKEVAVKVPPDRAPLAMAQCYEAMGFLTKASPYFEEAVRKQPDDVITVRAAARFYLQAGRLDVASGLLQRIIDRKLASASEQDVAWARHGLAVMLAASTDYRSFQRALRLVEMRLDESGVLRDAARASGPHDTDDELARARVLATQPQRQFREKAIELFEAAGRTGRLDHSDRFVLALLYDAADNWPKANEEFQSLVLSNGKMPQYLAQYALRLIREGDVDAAARWIGRLEKLEEERELSAGWYGTVELRARLLEKHGEGDKALALLKTYIRRPRARPDEMLYLIASLGRQQRFAEAFALCPEAWQKCPPEAAGGVTVALLRAMKPTDAEVAKAEGWLKSAIGKHPKNMALRLHLADLYDLRGRYAESEQQYRVVLREEPGNVIALNNLAWLLKFGNGGAEALPLIDAAVNGLGRRSDLLDTRALVYLKLNRVEDALADFKESTADKPTPTRLLHLAQAYHQAKEKDAASRTLQEAQKLGLQPAALHPLEQQDCKRLLEEYKLQ
jgi:cellulose synthase operon protein C